MARREALQVVGGFALVPKDTTKPSVGWLWLTQDGSPWVVLNNRTNLDTMRYFHFPTRLFVYTTSKQRWSSEQRPQLNSSIPTWLEIRVCDRFNNSDW
jgi:hypothetical protein